MRKSIEQSPLLSPDSDQEYQDALGGNELERREKALEKIRSFLFRNFELSDHAPLIKSLAPDGEVQEKERDECYYALHRASEMYKEKALQWALGDSISADALENACTELESFNEFLSKLMKGQESNALSVIYVSRAVEMYISLPEHVKKLLNLDENHSAFKRLGGVVALESNELQQIINVFETGEGEDGWRWVFDTSGQVPDNQIEKVLHSLGYSPDTFTKKIQEIHYQYPGMDGRTILLDEHNIERFQLRCALGEVVGRLKRVDPWVFERVGRGAVPSVALPWRDRDTDTKPHPFFKEVKGFPFRYDATDADIEKGLVLRDEFLRIAESVPGVVEIGPTTKAGYKQAYEAVKVELLGARTELRYERDKKRALEEELKSRKADASAREDEIEAGRMRERQAEAASAEASARERGLTKKLEAAQAMLREFAALGDKKSGGLLGKSEQERVLAGLLEKLKSSGLI